MSESGHSARPGGFLAAVLADSRAAMLRRPRVVDSAFGSPRELDVMHGSLPQHPSSHACHVSPVRTAPAGPDTANPVAQPSPMRAPRHDGRRVVEAPDKAVASSPREPDALRSPRASAGPDDQRGFTSAPAARDAVQHDASAIRARLASARAVEEPDVTPGRRSSEPSLRHHATGRSAASSGVGRAAGSAEPDATAPVVSGIFQDPPRPQEPSSSPASGANRDRMFDRDRGTSLSGEGGGRGATPEQAAARTRHSPREETATRAPVSPARQNPPALEQPRGTDLHATKRVPEAPAVQIGTLDVRIESPRQRYGPAPRQPVSFRGSGILSRLYLRRV